MAENESRTELTEKIRKDMQNSGIPLEFHVLNVCSTKNTGRMPGLRYEFLGEQKELDLLAFFEEIALDRKNDPSFQHTSTDLIIECKKRLEKPWVFISSPSYSFSNMMFHLQYESEFDLYFASKQLNPLLPQIYPKLYRNYYADPTIRRCISYYEAFKDPKQPSDIYKAIDNVVSYMLYRRACRVERAEEFGTFSAFYLPIVVLDGKLFEASITQNTIDVSERQHIQLRTFHREDIYAIDVVTRDYFATFFQMVEALHNEIVSAIRRLNLPAEFTTRAWLKHKELIGSHENGLTAMMKAEDARARRRFKRFHKKSLNRSNEKSH